MSDRLNRLEYVQVTKIYDECLNYLEENHQNVQDMTVTEESEYEVIKEPPRNNNHEVKETIEKNYHATEDWKYENERQSKEQNDLDTDNNHHSNDVLNYQECNKLIEMNHKTDRAIQNINNNDNLYETLNPAVRLSDHKLIYFNKADENKIKLALIEYNEPQNVLYETVNRDGKSVNNILKDDNIQVINNDQLENKAMKVNEATNDSNETLSYEIDDQNNKEKKIVISEVHQDFENISKKLKPITFEENNKNVFEKPIVFKLENEVKSTESLSSLKSERLRKLSQQLPKIIITSSGTSSDVTKNNQIKVEPKHALPRVDNLPVYNITRTPHLPRTRKAYGEFPKRLVSKSGLENVALISNVPFEKIRLLNDTFHTLINLRWRWIVIGTVVVHFLIWLVFAMFWYITALAHYDFEPDPPKRSCVTGGKDFITIFLASVETQTTIGFGDRTIDEECPEAIFLFIMQLILGTGLSGVLTCVVYAKLTRPEKLSRDGVGFSKKATICMRDGRLCLMIRAWDLNYDHIISSEFTAHFINTHKTKEGEIIRYYAQNLVLQQRQFLLWPVTLVHVIDHNSPLYKYGPEVINHCSYEITVTLKGASASMGTFTQSQTSYLPKEILWGHRFPPVVKYDGRKQKYVIDNKKLDITEAVETPYCSAEELNRSINQQSDIPVLSSPSSFSDKMAVFHIERISSFRKKNKKS